MIEALFSLSLLVAPATAECGPDGNLAADRAVEFWNNGDYDEALAAFRAAYACDGDADYIFAQARIEKMRHRCRDAIPLYEDYLATGPDTAPAAAAVDQLRECQQDVEPDPPDPPGQPPPPEPPPPTRDVPRPVRSDPLGGALLGAGALGVIAGFVTFAVGTRRIATADDNAMLTDYEQQVSRARNLNITGYALLGAGGALIVGAAIRYALLARRRARKSSARKSAARGRLPAVH